MVCPDTGEAVRLQLKPDGKPVPFRLADARALLVHFTGNAEQGLHMMPDFMRDHIGLRKIAGRIEARFELLEEGEIEIDLAIAGTVEGPHRRLRKAAGRLHRAGEKNEPRLLIAAVETRKNLMPAFLGIAKHDGDELRGLVRLGADGLILLRLLPAAKAALQQDAGVDAEKERNADDHEDADNAELAAAPARQPDRDPPAAAKGAARGLAAPVFDIVTPSPAPPSHDAPPDKVLARP